MTWTYSGEHERATYVFGDGGRTQTITWQWRVGEEWQPLCDRVAKRVD